MVCRENSVEACLTFNFISYVRKIGRNLQFEDSWLDSISFTSTQISLHSTNETFISEPHLHLPWNLKAVFSEKLQIDFTSINCWKPLVCVYYVHLVVWLCNKIVHIRLNCFPLLFDISSKIGLVWLIWHGSHIQEFITKL